MTTPDALKEFYDKKGHRMRGDEETRDFSDDDGQPDPLPVKRRRKSAVQAVRTTERQLDRKFRQASGTTSARCLGTSSASNAKGTVHMIYTGLNHADEKTYAHARRIEGKLETRLEQDEVTMPDTARGTLVKGMGHRLTWNVIELFKDMDDANQWQRDIIVSGGMFVVAMVLLYYAFGHLRPYLGI